MYSQGSFLPVFVLLWQCLSRMDQSYFEHSNIRTSAGGHTDPWTSPRNPCYRRQGRFPRWRVKKVRNVHRFVALCYNRTMDKDILNEVIGAEKEIQEGIEREQSRLREAVQCAQREADDSVARAARECSESQGREVHAAQQEAEARSRKVVDDAAALAARLERLGDRELIDIVLKQLPRILME